MTTNRLARAGLTALLLALCASLSACADAPLLSGPARSSSPAQSSSAPAPVPERFALASGVARGPGKVTEVTDGDTVKVRLDAGSTITIRVIGLNTPETVAPAQKAGAPPGCYGPQASAYARRVLADARVTVGVDPTQGTGEQRLDRYGRYLRTIEMAVRVDGDSDYATAAVRGGLGKAEKVPGPEPRAWRTLLAAQKEARDARRGVWACPR